MKADLATALPEITLLACTCLVLVADVFLPATRRHVSYWLAQGALLLTGNHNYSKPAFDLITGEITLEDGVWIGAKATVCPGVTCRSHAVLNVGSVASTELEAYGIYRGNPAMKVKQRQIS